MLPSARRVRHVMTQHRLHLDDDRPLIAGLLDRPPQTTWQLNPSAYIAPLAGLTLSSGHGIKTPKSAYRRRRQDRCVLLTGAHGPNVTRRWNFARGVPAAPLNELDLISGKTTRVAFDRAGVPSVWPFST
jgi:hypothetical protein